MVFMEISDMVLDSQDLFSSIPTFPDLNSGSLYNMPYNMYHDIFSDFRPERMRQYDENNNGAAHKPDKFIITEDNMVAFKKCYENGSIDRMVEDHGFVPSHYLKLFLVQELENASCITAEDSDKKGQDSFLEWAYENRHSFDASVISAELTGYLEDRSNSISGKSPETICLDKMHSYMSGLNSFLNKLDKLNTFIISENRYPEFLSVDSIRTSVKGYMKNNIDSIADMNLLFNALKQKHQNRCAPYLFIDTFKLLEMLDSVTLYQSMTINVLELFSSSYKRRSINGTLEKHKSDLQEIYGSLGGEKELFPYQEPICIEMPKNKKRRFKGTKYTKRHRNPKIRVTYTRKYSKILGDAIII